MYCIVIYVSDTNEQIIIVFLWINTYIGRIEESEIIKEGTTNNLITLYELENRRVIFTSNPFFKLFLRNSRYL